MGVSAKGLKSAVMAVKGYAASKASIPVLKNVKLETKDGHYAGPNERVVVNVPHFFLDKFKVRNQGAMCEENEMVSVQVSESAIRFEFELGAWMEVILDEGNFPDWKQIMAETSIGQAEIDLADYLRQLELLKTPAKDAAGIVKHRVNGQLDLIAESPDLGTMTRYVDTYSLDAGDIEYALNVEKAASVAEMVGYAGYREKHDRVTIKWNSKSAPFVFERAGCTAVCMPMHLRD